MPFILARALLTQFGKQLALAAAAAILSQIIHKQKKSFGQRTKEVVFATAIGAIGGSAIQAAGGGAIAQALGDVAAGEITTLITGSTPSHDALVALWQTTKVGAHEVQKTFHPIEGLQNKLNDISNTIHRAIVPSQGDILHSSLAFDKNVSHATSSIGHALKNLVDGKDEDKSRNTQVEAIKRPGQVGQTNAQLFQKIVTPKQQKATKMVGITKPKRISKVSRTPRKVNEKGLQRTTA